MFDLKRRQLDKKLNQARKCLNILPPKGGWIKNIRESLGISAEHLASRIGISPQAIHKLEKSEANQTVSLKTLKKVAQALDCQIVYFVLPTQSLENIIKKQIAKKAKKILELTNHTMTLEDQQNSQKEIASQLEELINQINLEVRTRKNISFIWDDN